MFCFVTVYYDDCCCMSGSVVFWTNSLSRPQCEDKPERKRRIKKKVIVCSEESEKLKNGQRIKTKNNTLNFLLLKPS